MTLCLFNYSILHIFIFYNTRTTNSQSLLMFNKLYVQTTIHIPMKGKNTIHTTMKGKKKVTHNHERQNTIHTTMKGKKYDTHNHERGKYDTHNHEREKIRYTQP